MKVIVLAVLVIVVVIVVQEADCNKSGRGKKPFRKHGSHSHSSHGHDDKHGPDCGCPPTPENGDVVDTEYYHVKVVQYKCQDGFVMEGADTSTCQADGTWGNVETTCKSPRAECPPPSAPADGAVVGTSYFEEDVITYTCNGGMRLIRDKTSTCQKNGTWSNTDVECAYAMG